MNRPDVYRRSAKAYLAAHPLLAVHKNMKLATKKRNLPITVDPAWLQALWERQGGICYWSGLPMVYSGGGTTSEPKAVSADRLYFEYGYVPGNVVLCCTFMNMARNSIPIQLWMQFVFDLGFRGLWDKNFKP